MTNRESIDLYAALSSLSESAQVIHEGKPLTVRPNWSGATAVKIARMKLALKPHKEAAEEARNTVVASYGGNVQPDHPQFSECVAKINEVMNAECPHVELGKLPLEEVAAQQGLNINALELLLPYLQ